MNVLRPVGNGASSRKYDLLTALGTMALAANPAEQRRVLRLMVAITARYNWAQDLLAVAQVELAKLWSVDERTVKRAMAEYRTRGWLVLKRPAARGRVAEYGLGIETLLLASREDWSRVGPDFEARLAPSETQAPSTVVRFPVHAPESLEPSEGVIWPRLQAMLAKADPDAARLWLQGLREEALEAGVLVLRCKGRYQANYLRTHLAGRLLGAAQRLNGQIRAVEIRCDADH